MASLLHYGMSKVKMQGESGQKNSLRFSCLFVIMQVVVYLLLAFERLCNESASLLVASTEGKMLMQAIKHWLEKMFAWWPWRLPAKAENPPTLSTLNKGGAQNAALLSRTPVDEIAPKPEVAPCRSTTEEWPEHAETPSFPSSPAPLPTPPLEKARETLANTGETSSASGASSAATPEQHLAFLHYLVKRGIVNEGFAEDKIPQQYKKD